jgi:hypothetical protein
MKRRALKREEKRKSERERESERARERESERAREIEREVGGGRGNLFDRAQRFKNKNKPNKKNSSNLQV